ncbi:Cytochrome c peroxidase [Noviherbaspirillum suwonense]|uniref:Cytochrome c peroxidase n=1 Tax=Noviherbaspirillum suwonense TaxID=1224511 RepID=A0ABY1QE57_9BURK|nr:Cytochrome c peroxidase [Noviherbaspirillum suwonense]
MTLSTPLLTLSARRLRNHPLPSDRPSSRGIRALAGILVTFCLGGAVSAEPAVSALSLKSVPIPGPSHALLSQFVADKTAAIQLGKALFWDARVGSDNKTACATCHFAAGADTRVRNQVSPGLLRLSPGPDRTFQLGGAPNHKLSADDFPFTRYASLNDAGARLSDLNDVASSAGVFTTAQDGLVTVSSSGGPDNCSYVADDVIGHGGDGFNIGGVNTRRVEPRNSPSVINAVFNFRNFWDGRGNNVFNGGDPFGARNPQPLVWKRVNGVMVRVPVLLPSSSLASQASGPPLSGTEMSCRNRAFVMLGQKLLDQDILAGQAISPNDSVLGKHAKSNRPSYRHLVKQAFRPEWWNAPSTARFTNADARAAASMDLDKPAQFRQAFGVDVGQAELNFSLFFSLAIQLYESTLVSDDTPFDRYVAGDSKALDESQKAGLAIFMGKGRCINCHGGAELSNASFRNVTSQRLERMAMANGASKVYDTGFYNIGVRPYGEDVGVGGTDPWGQPLSESMMALSSLSKLLGNDFSSARNPAPAGPDDVSVMGAFKTPGLRNVELTGPYFHNGGKSTLMQVVDFYNRGSDFAAENRSYLAPDIQPLGLTEPEKMSLVSFLVSLTDERVRWRKAPFDHPSLCLPQGAIGDTLWVKPDAANPANAADDLSGACMGEVGASGSGAPLGTFLSLPPGRH